MKGMPKPAVLLMALGAALAAGACGAPPREASAPLFEGIGTHRRPIATTSPMAQRYFDQGLVFAYSFNHDEAVRSFTEAARLDPQAPMPWWGIALSLGPHINNAAVPPERERAAWEAVQQALERIDRAAPAERALIEALSLRYAGPRPAAAPPVDRAPLDRAPLDRAYAAAMRAVWKAHPQDADAGTLFAESLMDLRPWDLWQPDGTPQPGTEEILSALEAVLRLDPGHPGALHLSIHALEGSPEPGRALAAADALRHAVPVSGHMLHMPSHIDVLLGRWDEAVDANLRATAADRRYREVSPRQEFLHVYIAHNQQMLAFAAMMDGRGRLAVEAARSVAQEVPDEYARRETAVIEPFFLIADDALVRFGRWEEILAEPAPPDHLLLATAMRRFARGAALAALGRVPEAQEELRLFREAAAAVPPERLLAINPAERVLAIAERVLAGEIAYRRGAIDESVAALREAIAIEDALAYMEPPEWTIPVRHTLGAVLLDAGRVAEAEAAYREDLASWPENGWSLRGLANCLRRRGVEDEAVRVEERLRRAWAQADIEIATSCLCVRGG